MTTRGPFTVWLSTPDDSIAVDARDVQFSKTWRGGFKDANVTLRAPLNRRSPMLAPFAKLRIDDARTCRTAWEGYVDLPGKSRSDEGDVWQIGAVGPSARLSDRQRPYIAIDSQLDGWTQILATNSAMSAGVGGLPDAEDTEALVLTFPNGIPVGSNSRVVAAHAGLKETGQLLGGYSVTHREGFTAGADWKFQVLVHVDGDPQTSRDVLYNTSVRSQTLNAGQTNFGTNKNVLKFRIVREGAATNVNSDTNWSGVTFARVSAMQRSLDGTYFTGAGSYSDTAPVGTILGTGIIPDALYWFTADLVGADWVGPIDIANASIVGKWLHPIDQFAYTEPTTMQQVLEDIALLEPSTAWGVFESNAGGQHRFATWEVSDGSTKPVTLGDYANESGARYLATSEDGWDSPGGEADLRNAITITWTDRKGKQHTRSYTSDVDFDIQVEELEQWFIRRDADMVDLGPQLGSVANADRIAENILTAAASVPQSGTLTVGRKIHDLWNGRDVEPWEIEAGYPLLLQDIDIDPLPITEVSYNDQDATAALTLSEPVLTTDQWVNRLARPRPR